MTTFIGLNLVLQVVFYTIFICDESSQNEQSELITDEFDCDNFEINAISRRIDGKLFVSRSDKYWYQHENIDTVKTAIVQNASQLVNDFKRIDIALFFPVGDNNFCPQRFKSDSFCLYERSSCLWKYIWNGWEKKILPFGALWRFQYIVINSLFKLGIVKCQDLISMAYQSNSSDPKGRNVFGLAGHRIFVTTCFDRSDSRSIESSWEDFANRPLSDIFNIYDHVGDWPNIATMYYNETVDSFVIIDKKGDMFVCPVDDAAERIRSNSTFVNKLPCKPWHRVAYYLGFCNGTMPPFILTSTTIATTITQHTAAEISIDSTTKISNTIETLTLENVDSSSKKPKSSIVENFPLNLTLFLFCALIVGLLLTAFFIWKCLFGKTSEEPMRIGKEWSTMDPDTSQTLSISSVSTESTFSAKNESKKLIN